MPRTYTFEGKRQQRWTQAHTERATEMRKQGLSFAAIGKELGFTAATAMRYVKGTQPKPEPKSEPPPAPCRHATTNHEQREPWDVRARYDSTHPPRGHGLRRCA